jgi:uncharacterized protein (DUF1501 family)
MPELVTDPSQFLTDDTIKRMVLPASSQLKTALTAARVGGKYTSEVSLDASLMCTDNECDVDTVRVVRVSASPNIYYEYVPPPCVEHPFYLNAVTINERYSDERSDTMCADPSLATASEACCTPTNSNAAVINPAYDGERMSFATAEARCASIGRVPCSYSHISGSLNHKIDYHWTMDNCKVLAKVAPNGDVAIVHDPESYPETARPLHVADDTGNFFPVAWEAAWPKVSADGSCGGCGVAADGACICETTVQTSAVFDSVPTKEEMLASLHIGSVDPNLFDPGTYGQGTYNADKDVRVYRKFPDTNGVNVNTIFEFVDAIGRTHYLQNIVSTVSVNAGRHQFRNPVQFMSLALTEESVGKALHETDAVIDHFFFHPNTAPFLAIRFCQRFGVSNPSPRFVTTVAQAFRTGRYEDPESGIVFGEGTYGDMASTFAAVVLDREARTPVLDADPSHGAIREPLVKVLSILRAMEFRSNEDVNVFNLDFMSDAVGQMAHSFSSVFSFFLPEFVPPGRLSHSGLAAPEAMVLNMPKTVSTLNGIFSLFKFGLAKCHGGFGEMTFGSCNNDGDFTHGTASPHFVPNGAKSAAVVSELSTLLTSGRLSVDNRQIVEAAHASAKASGSSAREALALAQQLIATTPEFHTTNIVTKSFEERPEQPTPPDTGKSYKAVIYLVLAGGVDSFQMLIPHTCTKGPDLYQQYSDVRETLALRRQDLIPLDATGSGQACETFGLHPKLRKLAELYDEGDALFAANIGVMSQPTNTATYSQDTETQLFAHNTMQREATTVDPYNAARGTGVLGRMNDVLGRHGYRTGAIAIEKQSMALVGEEPNMLIVGQNGLDKFNPRPSMNRDAMVTMIRDLNGASTLDSGFFGETWSSSLVESLVTNEELYTLLEETTSTNNFPSTSIGQQFETISKLMKLKEERSTDRDVFFVSMGGFDNHNLLNDNLDRLFASFNSALGPFVEELKDHGMWDSTVLVETSDFARTLSPNSGAGTDHGWGGNTFVLGGSVRGGFVKGEFPSDLTDAGSSMLPRGRVVPTLPFDAVWHSVAEWAGVTDMSEMTEVLPNAGNFGVSDGTLFRACDLFDTACPVVFAVPTKVAQ